LCLDPASKLFVTALNVTDLIYVAVANRLEVRRESRIAKDPAIKSFAQQTLPTLKDHLKEAEKIAPKQQQAERTSGQ
jgi:Domain of unknown function (DUF4142)